ncbi:uncharacterized protein METZ01_LOCUS412111 [marine metagenome]|uniref:Uncharacterized protein n=1 Tax=marine metagenome TaxID=408172 RepID=A0A382WK89_9ZZZZ
MPDTKIVLAMVTASSYLLGQRTTPAAPRSD